MSPMDALTLKVCSPCNGFNNMLPLHSQWMPMYIYTRAFHVGLYLSSYLTSRPESKVYIPRWWKLSGHFVVTGKTPPGKCEQVVEPAGASAAPRCCHGETCQSPPPVHWCWRPPPDQSLATCQACPILGSYTATDPHAHPAVKPSDL